MKFEHLNAMIESNSHRKDLTLDLKIKSKVLWQAVSYSIRPVGNVCSMSVARRSAILNNINSHGALTSLGKEDYTKVGRKLFRAGFDERLKARAETTKTLVTASSVGRGTS